MKPEGLVWRLKLGDVKLLRTLQKFNFIWVWPVFCVAFLFPRNRGIQDTNVRRSSDWGREQARVGRERQGPGRNAIYSRCQERVLGAQLWEAQSGAPPPPGLSGNNSELAACFHHLESEVSVSEGGGRCAEWLPGLHAGGGEPGLHAGGDKLLTLFGVELSPPTLMLFWVCVRGFHTKLPDTQRKQNTEDRLDCGESKGLGLLVDSI